MSMQSPHDADGTRTARVPLPPNETGPVPVHYDRVQPRYFGVTPPMLLFALAFAGLCVALVLFVTGHWPVGLILLGLAVLAFAAFLEAARRKPDTAMARVTADAAFDARARTRAGLEVMGARGRAAREALRVRRELRRAWKYRQERLTALGEATYLGDTRAADVFRREVAEVDAFAAQLTTYLDAQLDAAEHEVRNARLEVQQTQMVEIPEPYPPPDEGTPPQPAPVPEPYPGPEIVPPVPDPVPTPLGPDPGQQQR